MNPMNLATKLGYTANLKGEIPIGAVIVKNNKVIAKAYNKKEKHQIATHHAEILAIQKANKKLHSWRLDDCDIYVNKEPCPMCAGAIVGARIKNLFYAVKDKDNGGVSRFNILNNTNNHTTNSTQLCEFEKENLDLIQIFFKNKRKLQKNKQKSTLFVDFLFYLTLCFKLSLALKAGVRLGLITFTVPDLKLYIGFDLI